MTAKLTVSDPRSPFFIKIEGKCVDENRFSVHELNIIGARVFKDHAVVQRREVDPEGQDGCVPERGKRPFVRVRYEGDPIRPDDTKSVLKRTFSIGLDVRDQPAFIEKIPEEAGLVQLQVLFRIGRIDLTVQYPVACKDRSGGVPKRSVVSGFTCCHLLSPANRCPVRSLFASSF